MFTATNHESFFIIPGVSFWRSYSDRRYWTVNVWFEGYPGLSRMVSAVMDDFGDLVEVQR